MKKRRSLPDDSQELSVCLWLGGCVHISYKVSVLGGIKCLLFNGFVDMSLVYLLLSSHRFHVWQILIDDISGRKVMIKFPMICLLWLTFLETKMMVSSSEALVSVAFSTFQ